MDSLILLLPLALLALLFFSNSRRRREAATVQSALAPGAEIITTAGLYATVVEVEDVAVVLETSPGVRTRWARAAVARVTSPSEAQGSLAPVDDDADLTGTTGTGQRDDVPGGAVPDDLAALDPDRAPGAGERERHDDRPGSSSGAARADGPDLTKRPGTSADAPDAPDDRRP